MIDTTEFHPIANIWPLLADDELQELVTDIAANGLHYAIWRHRDGRIIDGRNRWTACQKAGVECPSNTYMGDDGAELVAFVVSLNEKRRHLSESQRAMVAARIEQLRQGRPEKDASLHVSRASAAEMLQVSPRSVADAKAVQRTGSPELVQAVERGKVAVSTAAAIAKAPAERQREIVARGRDEIVKAASRIKREEKERKKAERETRAVAIQAALPAASDRWRLIHAAVADLGEIEAASVDCIIIEQLELSGYEVRERDEEPRRHRTP